LCWLFAGKNITLCGTEVTSYTAAKIKTCDENKGHGTQVRKKNDAKQTKQKAKKKLSHSDFIFPFYNSSSFLAVP